MNRDAIKSLLQKIQEGSCTVEEGMKSLASFPSERLSSGCIDHQRQLRTGIPEVIFGESKNVKQIIDIVRAMQKQGSAILVTRVKQDKAKEVCRQTSGLTYHPLSQLITSTPPAPIPEHYHGTSLIVSAGTSDLPVAQEAQLTLQMFAHPVKLITDIGVAGLHRLLDHHDTLRKAEVIIVVAGMEGALPSVIAGLVDAPVIGVPTSVGYGASFGGIAALLGMLNSCAPGVAVVNIDNGFGAACMADSINRKKS